MKKKTGTGLLMSVLAVSLAVTPCYAATQKKKLTDVQEDLTA